MKLDLLLVGKTRESFLQAGIDEFKKRLGRFVPVEIRVIKDRKWGKGVSGSEIKVEEGKLLLSRLDKASISVALDPAGKEVSSEQLAEMLVSWEEQGRRQVTFIIGGAFGLAGEVLDSADMKLSLSRMTFTHEMARLILLEQLYRAYNIKAGTEYHK